MQFLRNWVTELYFKYCTKGGIRLVSIAIYKEEIYENCIYRRSKGDR